MQNGDPCLVCSSLDTSVVLDYEEHVLACHRCGYNT